MSGGGGGHVLVTGGTGFVGGAVVRRFLTAGWQVTLLVRDPARARARFGDAVGYLAGDLAGAELPALPPVTAIVHAAADMDWGHDTVQMAVINVQGTARLLAAAQALTPPPRFVHVSTQAVYGFDVHYENADETTPMRVSPHAYCETKRLAEELVWRVSAAGLPVAVVRPGFIYGPGDVRTLPLVAAQLKKRQIRHHVDGGEFDTGCIHVENCAEGIFLAATHPAAVGEAFNLGDGRVLTIRQLTADVAAKLGVPAPTGSVPFAAAMAAGRVVAGTWRFFRLGGPPPLSPFLVAMLRRNSGFSIAKAREKLGYVPTRQWEESLDETLAACGVTP